MWGTHPGADLVLDPKERTSSCAALLNATITLVELSCAKVGLNRAATTANANNVRTCFCAFQT